MQDSPSHDSTRNSWWVLLGWKPCFKLHLLASSLGMGTSQIEESWNQSILAFDHDKEIERPSLQLFLGTIQSIQLLPHYSSLDDLSVALEKFRVKHTVLLLQVVQSIIICLERGCHNDRGCTGEVYKVVFYMKTFGSPTPKRTMVITNSPAVCRLAKVKGKRVRKTGGKPLCQQYLDKRGRRAFKGTSALKQSQFFSNFSYHFCFHFRLYGFKPFLFSAKCHEMLSPKYFDQVWGSVWTCCVSRPRLYPRGFAKAVVQLVPQIRKKPVDFTLQVVGWGTTLSRYGLFVPSIHDARKSIYFKTFLQFHKFGTEPFKQSPKRNKMLLVFLL